MKKILTLVLAVSLSIPALAEPTPSAPQVPVAVIQDLNKPLSPDTEQDKLSKKKTWAVIILVVITAAVTVAAYAAGRTNTGQYTSQ